MKKNKSGCLRFSIEEKNEKSEKILYNYLMKNALKE